MKKALTAKKNAFDNIDVMPPAMAMFRTLKVNHDNELPSYTPRSLAE